MSTIYDKAIGRHKEVFSTEEDILQQEKFSQQQFNDWIKHPLTNRLVNRINKEISEKISCAESAAKMCNNDVACVNLNKSQILKEILQYAHTHRD